MSKSGIAAAKRLWAQLDGGEVNEKFIRALRKALSAQDRRHDGLDVSSTAPSYDPVMILEAVYARRPRVAADQAAKGIGWLRKLYRTPKGKVRSNSPFGWNERQIIDDFSHFTLTGFVGPENYPVYRVHARGGLAFSYHARPWQAQAFGTDKRPIVIVN